MRTTWKTALTYISACLMFKNNGLYLRKNYYGREGEDLRSIINSHTDSLYLSTRVLRKLNQDPIRLLVKEGVSVESKHSWINQVLLFHFLGMLASHYFMCQRPQEALTCLFTLCPYFQQKVLFCFLAFPKKARFISCNKKVSRIGVVSENV